MSDRFVPTPLASPRFGRYSKYRDSGVEWLGEIPAHWEIRRLKGTVVKCQNGVWGGEPDGEHDIACIRVADFNRRTHTVEVSEPTLRSVDPRVASTHRLREGDLLLEKSGGGERQPVGAVVLFATDLRAVCSNFIARMPVQDSCDSQFLVYLYAALYSRRINLRSIKQSIGIQNLDGAAYLNESVGIPSRAEQSAIAAFLNRETARTDALIAKQRELISLLQEKRTALISHTVTKGLDPDVAMKDSGVEWLGEIPGHWEMAALRYRYEQSLGKMLDTKKITGDHLVPYLRNVDVQWDNINSSDLPSMDIRALVAAVARGAFADGQGSTIAHLTGDMLRAHRFPFPPTAEQHAIANFLDCETARIDAMIAKVNQAIDHLTEYRTALISAAVTGQIDVRHRGDHMVSDNTPTTQARP